MHHKSSLKHNNEIKDNIFDKQFPLHNITHEVIHKYMLIFLLNDFCSNMFCWYFFNQTRTDNYIYI